MFIRSIIIFFVKIYYKKSFTEIYLNNRNLIFKNNNSTHNLFNYSNNLDESYYYDVKKHHFKKIKINSYDGFDMRKNISVYDNDNISLYNISIFFYKKNLLELLNNKDINIHHKLSYIKEYKKIFDDSRNNLNDLMKDWYSEET